MPPPWDLIVADWLSRELPAATPRLVRTRDLQGKADAVVGMRRSGKTWLLLGEIAAERSAGVPASRSLYVSLEDERLAGVEAVDLGGLVEAWFRRHPDAATSRSWLVLDEVQNVPGWETFVRRMLDRGGLRVAVTGSSAKLLSREIATSLRGRAWTTELLPFGLAERLVHLGHALPTVWPPPEAERAVLQHEADRYLLEGGFPEVVGLDRADRRRILRDYVDVVLLRDVVERHGDTNLPALRRLVHRLASAPATTFSVHKVHNDLRSQGVAVSKDTLYAYVDHVEDAYLAFRVPIRSESERVRATNPVKTYAIDPGLAHAYAARPQPGHLLENAVYLELRRRGGDISWVRTASGREVDFAVDRDGDLSLVQVCWDPTEDGARDRELRAVTEAMAELDVREATVVTRLHSEDVETDAGTVRFVPAWEWLVRS